MREIPVGLCQCGCGQPTTIPTSTNRKIGRFKGVPMRYVSGHNARGQKLRSGPDWLEEDLGYTSPCWIWQHGLSKGGYGRATLPAGGGQEYAHRLAWEAENGPIPEGFEIDHLCHNADLSCAGGSTCRHRACVNPEHLEAVTPRVNSQRGRTGATGRAHQLAKTHCPKGHPYSGENLYVTPEGKRSCKACRRDQLKASRARRKAGLTPGDRSDGAAGPGCSPEGSNDGDSLGRAASTRAQWARFIRRRHSACACWAWASNSAACSMRLMRQ